MLDHGAVYRETGRKQSNKLKGEMGFAKCQEGNKRGTVMGVNGHEPPLGDDFVR